MNFRMAMALLAGTCILPVYAAESPSDTTTPAAVRASTVSHPMSIEVSALISPGRYTADIAPIINSSMAGRLQKALGKLKGVSGVKADVDDSAIHFVVKNGGNVHMSDLLNAVAEADSGAVMSVPILEGSYTANPGL